MKHIIVVDGFSGTRKLLCQLISNTQKQYAVDQAMNVVDAEAIIRQKRVNLVILDISKPTKNGLEALLDLKQLFPKIPVLVINGPDHAKYADHFLDIRCEGYLTKDADYAELCKAIQAILAGDSYFPSIHQSSAQLPEKSRYPKRLSSREMQIFLKTIKGMTTKSMSNELKISSSTVSVTKSNIMRKMQLRDRRELIMYALRQEWLPPNYIFQPR
ncbi:LuxR family two component transcriptional regulator [Methylovorus glucosotrophus]|jgi:DNA-binding NarL/FixJ family response regulator|uniref:response regulator n=1 Tax=Methylovorus glucosotrophus TaxID=266009 RepID=UPI0013315490|nr:response regulator transcription factor [Methylovorus glucosotrophus]KAF0843998.1 LuxR family two component transcriptional regulator [Methylovorus glucosotrophus]